MFFCCNYYLYIISILFHIIILIHIIHIILLLFIGINFDGLGVFIIPVCRYVVISIFSNAELLVHNYACFTLPQRHNVYTYVRMCMYVYCITGIWKNRISKNVGCENFIAVFWPNYLSLYVTQSFQIFIKNH